MTPSQTWFISMNWRGKKVEWVVSSLWRNEWKLSRQEIRGKLKLEKTAMWTWPSTTTHVQARRWCQNLNLKWRWQNVCFHGWKLEAKRVMEMLVWSLVFQNVPSGISGIFYVRASCLQTYFCLWYSTGRFPTFRPFQCVWVCVWYVCAHVRRYTDVKLHKPESAYWMHAIWPPEYICTNWNKPVCLWGNWRRARTQIHGVRRDHHFPSTFMCQAQYWCIYYFTCLSSH